MAKQRGYFRWAGVALCVAGLTWRAGADVSTNAVTATNGFTSGGVILGGVGFYFVPTATISLTNVSFLDSQDFQDANVSIWSGTNSVLTNYDFGPTTNSQMTISTNVMFTLTAGQPYAIMVQDGALANSNYVCVQVYVSDSNSTEFTVAPELFDYQEVTVSTNGTFTLGLTNAFLYGVNFGILDTNGPPLLRIADTVSDSVLVSWISPSTGYILETNANLATNTWLEYVGAINDNGTNKSVTISPPVGNLFFRLRFVPF